MDNDDVWLGDQLRIATFRNLIKKGPSAQNKVFLTG